MAKDRRDRDLAQALQEMQASLPPPVETDGAAPAEAVAPPGAVEARMMAAVEVLEALPVRERLGVLYALLPDTLEELDGLGRSAVLEELFLATELTPTT
jgi:hypothetical protein